MKKILTIIGNRPQFIKLAATSKYLRGLGSRRPYDDVVVNTGQHYDALMSDVFFEDLVLPVPKYDLQIGSGHIVDQTGRMLRQLREIINAERPGAVMLYGDTISTLAGALAAAHSGVPVIHVEAGERFYRRAQIPEEINRVVTDTVAALNLAVSRKAYDYLRREGMDPRRVRFTGDIMYDLFLTSIEQCEERASISPRDFGCEPNGYILSTIHRAENTDAPEVLIGILGALDRAPLPTILPAHPRTVKLLDAAGWRPAGNLKLVAPLGYFDFLRLLKDCALVVSDSGGVTREAFFGGKGCVVPAKDWVWTEPVEAGWLIEAGQDPEDIHAAISSFRPTGAPPVQAYFGDGKAAQRIVEETAKFLDEWQGEAPWHPLGRRSELPKTEISRTSFAELQAFLKAGAAAGFVFMPLAQGLKDAAHSPLAILRHHVAIDPCHALDMARIEAEAGARGTFFIAAASPCYNLMELKTRTAIMEIRAMGHELGLLLEASAGHEPAVIRHYIAILETMFDTPITAIASINEAPAALAAAIGMPSADHGPAVQGARFISDAEGRWPITAHTIFDGGGRIDVLLHPIWWNEIPTGGFESLMRAADRKRDALWRAFAARSGRMRVGWLAGGVD